MNLATWNMQGSSYTSEQKWNTGVANLFQAQEAWRPDVICVQESGAAPTSAVQQAAYNFPFPGAPPPGAPVPSVQVYGWGGTGTRPARTVVFHQWDLAGNRVNLAIVTRTALPAPVNVSLTWTAAGPSWRPILGVQTPAGWVYSIHAISPGGPDAAGLVAAAAAAAGGAWWVAGDFNREPGTFAVPAGSVACPPNNPTHPTNPGPTARLDFCVRSGAAAVVGTVASVLMSDHYPVAYVF